MTSPLSQLEARYLNACQNQKVIPNSSMVLSLAEARYKKARFGKCILEIYIDHLDSLDIPPLLDTLSGSLSGIDMVNIRQKSSNASLDGENLLLLFQAVNQKLRIVDLINSSSWKDVLRDICQRGMACQILNLRFSPIRKLNMTGKFMELQTLNLDSSVHLTSFHIDCFSCMPKLMRLSMCETRVANLWMTTAALSNLHSLSELRFQNCSCCYDTGPCPTFGGVFGMVNDNKHSNKQQTSSYFGAQCISTENNLKPTIVQSVDNSLNSLFSKNCLLSSNELLESTTEESTDESDPEFSDTFTEFCRQNNPDSVLSPSKHSAPSSTHSSVSSTAPFLVDTMHLGRRLDNSNSFTGYATRGETCHKNDSSMSEVTDSVNFGKTTGNSLENHISSHPSPICFERYYREYIVTSFPHLKVLDNIPIGFVEREQAKIIFMRYFESAPYNRRRNDSIVSILHRREANRAIFSQTFSKVKQSFCRESNHSFLRSLSAAKAGSSTQTLHSISKITSGPNEESKSFRPRQFEYHPTDPRLMAFGTLDGELIVINHESEKLVGYLPSVGTLNSILALCWLKKHPAMILAGSDNGSLQLNDVCKMPSKVTDQYHSQNASIRTFHEFQQLTSVHVNSTDDYFLASGYSNHVALYDMGSGRRLQIFKDLHKEHINVVKFAHHSPSLFATASFDKEIKMWDLRLGTSQPCYTASSSRGNVMLCFSPDDYYLLTSSVDNEVRQLLAVDGRLHTSFDIPFTGNSQNYTRSYYINGRDYIISGSCEEHVVRICCARTGRRLRDVYLEGRGSRNSMYIQSLRGDPFRDFHMSILAAYWRPSKFEIIKVNLLQSEECPRESTSV
ncbi:uncharacterized protein LOC121985155 [Zingiber officinale]|uniref:DWD hypersensitive to UV-B 1 N-terminal domain-containing protein n=1 Tax=Zingiber officinale TaxID=94328 RepID=A0A8J5GQP9_ZINOF|nr:uncharacterized protein LOC121985155 [Zingiber officinale]KAG6504272.1 hypothetical protein ZIOFF_036603 [Zingiber officinale]